MVSDQSILAAASQTPIAINRQEQLPVLFCPGSSCGAEAINILPLVGAYLGPVLLAVLGHVGSGLGLTILRGSVGRLTCLYVWIGVMLSLLCSHLVAMGGFISRPPGGLTGSAVRLQAVFS